MAGAINNHDIAEARADECLMDAMAALHELKLRIENELNYVQSQIHQANVYRNFPDGMPPTPANVIRFRQRRAA